MEITNIKTCDKFLTEYIKLCSLEWETKKTTIELENYIIEKKKKILNDDKVISVLSRFDESWLL